MKSNFNVEEFQLKQVKSIIRKLPSLRFENNPDKNGKVYRFNLSGDVKDFNKLEVELNKLEIQQEKYLTQILSFFIEHKDGVRGYFYSFSDTIWTLLKYKLKGYKIKVTVSKYIDRDKYSIDFWAYKK